MHSQVLVQRNYQSVFDVNKHDQSSASSNLMASANIIANHIGSANCYLDQMSGQAHNSMGISISKPLGNALYEQYINSNGMPFEFNRTDKFKQENITRSDKFSISQIFNLSSSKIEQSPMMMT